MTNFLSKVAQIVVRLFGVTFETITFEVKTAVCLLFWATFEKIGLHLIPTSGHTDWYPSTHTVIFFLLTLRIQIELLKNAVMN